MVSHLNTIIPKSEYLGKRPDYKDTHDVKWIHVFKFFINNEASYILIREYENGKKVFHSFSDSENVTIGTKK